MMLNIKKHYTKCINYLLQQHCKNHHIITIKQAGGEKNN